MKKLEAVLAHCFNTHIYTLILILLIIVVPIIGYGQTATTFDQALEDLRKTVIAKEAQDREQAAINRDAESIQRAKDQDAMKAENDAYFGHYGFTEGMFVTAIRADDIDLERVWELRKVESRANFVVAKLQSHDQTVEATDRPSMGRNFAFFQPQTQAQT